MTEILLAGDRATPQRLADRLIAGGVAVVPTDTLYGLAACPDDASAVERMFELKGRSHDVPVAVLCGSAVQALSLSAGVDADTATLAATHWPGPLTLVLPRNPEIDWDLGEPHDTIGVRCPDHPLLRSVAERIGPVAVTSANRHGEPTPSTAAEAAASLVGPADMIIDGGSLDGAASTVVSVVDGTRRILRSGPLSL